MDAEELREEELGAELQRAQPDARRAAAHRVGRRGGGRGAPSALSVEDGGGGGGGSTEDGSVLEARMSWRRKSTYVAS